MTRTWTASFYPERGPSVFHDPCPTSESETVMANVGHVVSVDRLLNVSVSDAEETPTAASLGFASGNATDHVAPHPTYASRAHLPSHTGLWIVHVGHGRGGLCHRPCFHLSHGDT